MATQDARLQNALTRGIPDPHAFTTPQAAIAYLKGAKVDNWPIDGANAKKHPRFLMEVLRWHMLH